MKKDINPNQVFVLKFLKENSFDEMWRSNIKDVMIKNVKNSQQNLKRIPVIRNRTSKIYQDIWPFHHKAPATLRKMKAIRKLQGETIPMTPLFDEMFSDFDDLHKQLHTKQKKDNFQGKKQEFVNLKQVVSEEEAKKVFDVLLSTKQKIKSDESRKTQTEIGRNKEIQITTYLFLTSSNKKGLQKNLKIRFKKVNLPQFKNTTNDHNNSKLITETDRKKNDFIHKRGISNTSMKHRKQVKATEKIVLNSCSYQAAEPERKKHQAVNTTCNLQGETIPKTYSNFLSRLMNEHPFEADNDNYLSSNLIRLGNKFKDGIRNTSGGVGNHLKVFNRELPDNKALQGERS
jgi:hypothetical protein